MSARGVMTEAARSEMARVARYLVVGLSAVAIDFVVYAALVELGVWYLAAKVVSLALATAAAYLGHRHWTFGDIDGREGTLPRYLLVQGTCLAASLLLLALLVDVIGLGPIVAQAIVLPAIAVSSFLAQRYWAFAAEVRRA